MTSPTPAQVRTPALSITIPLKTVNELNAHTHWRVRQRRAKQQRAVVAANCWAKWAVSVAGELGCYFPCRVKFTRVAPGNGLDPGDGLPSAFKFVRDSIAELVGVDDRDPRYVWEYDQRRGRKGEYAVEIEITPADAGKVA